MARRAVIDMLDEPGPTVCRAPEPHTRGRERGMIGARVHVRALRAASLRPLLTAGAPPRVSAGKPVLDRCTWTAGRPGGQNFYAETAGITSFLKWCAFCRRAIVQEAVDRGFLWHR